MVACKGVKSPQCKAIFAKKVKNGTYRKELANITPRSKKGKRAVNGLSGAPKRKRKSLSGLNGFGTMTWLLITGVILLAIGFGGFLGAAHYKTMQMNGIIADEEAKSKGKLSDTGKKETLDKLKKLNVLEVHNFRDVLKGVREGKLTEDKMTEKQKGYYKKTGFPLPSQLAVNI